MGKTLACGAAACCLAALQSAAAIDLKASGRMTVGSAWRLEAPDPNFMVTYNAAAAGQAGLSSSGANADDPNLNFRRHDATSTALKGYLDLALDQGGFGALLRVKAWHDFALAGQPRAWGNVANGYAAGEPLSDAGAPPLSRFSGVAIAAAYLQQLVDAGGVRLFGRAGLQTLEWGAKAGFAGGLDALNPRDLPAGRRAGAAGPELRVPIPVLFARAELDRTVAIEGFYQTAFRASAVDMCGTFWSFNDYLVDGCDKVMSGPPTVSDRARIPLGAYLKRVATPPPRAGEYGMALTWKSAALGAEIGLYQARYTSRIAMPGLSKSERAGPAVIAGDPDGKNLAFITEYPEAIVLRALTFAHRSGVYGELSYRPNLPLMFSPGDVLPALFSPTAPALLRADATALAPGALFHGFERYPMLQAQLGFQRDLGAGWSAGAEVVSKRLRGLPDPALRRFGRADFYGIGAVGGSCVVTKADAARQCSQRGYVSSDALAWRVRLDARLPAPAPGLAAAATLGYVHDARGWSGDGMINEGRHTAQLALRFEYHGRYLGELAYAPIWGGDYNAAADRDQLSLSVGVKF